MKHLQYRFSVIFMCIDSDVTYSKKQILVQRYVICVNKHCHRLLEGKLQVRKIMKLRVQLKHPAPLKRVTWRKLRT